MLLTLDIGNTNIKSALFKGDDMNEFMVHPDAEKAMQYFDLKKFNEIACCSVNPFIEQILNKYFVKRGYSVFTISFQNKFNLKINYETPESLGMDRVCSAVGALDIATNGKMLSDNQYLICVDFGTATTINIVSPSGEFIGGLIAPGINTMLKSLNEKTAQLPLIQLNSYKGIIGNSTSSAMTGGVITATIGMINETVNELKFKSNQILPLIFVTGGNAELVIPHIKYKTIFEAALLLKGLKVVYELNKV